MTRADSSNKPDGSDRRYELILRFMYEGLQASGKSGAPMSFKERHLQRVFPFVLHDLAAAHIRGLGFRMNRDGNYPDITQSLVRMRKDSLIYVESHSDDEPIYRFSLEGTESLPRLLDQCATLRNGEMEALKESFPQIIRYFIRKVDYMECVRETDCLEE